MDIKFTNWEDCTWGWDQLAKIQKTATFVDLYAANKQKKLLDLLSGGYQSYVISRCDDTDKITIKCRNCTGIAVTGKDINSEMILSVESHQNPDYFLDEKLESFTFDLIRRLKELKKRVKTETIDIIAFGGVTTNDHHLAVYKDSMDLLNSLVETVFNRKCRIIAPKTRCSELGEIDYLETQKGIFHCIRKECTTDNGVRNTIGSQDYIYNLIGST